MRQCCYTMKSISIECHCKKQSGPDTFTLEEIRRYISSTTN